MSIKRPFKLLSIVEATTITGPMKPLLMFARHLRDEAHSLPALHHSVLTTVRARPEDLVTTTPSNDFIAAARSSGLEVDVVAERRALDFGVLGQMAEHLRRRAPDIVETHDFKSHFLMRLLRRRADLPSFRWLAFHHGYTRMSWRVRVYQQLDRVSLPQADRVITVCKPFVKQLTDRGVDRSRIRVSANAVESRPTVPIADRARLRRTFGLEEDSFILLSVGRLSKEKGLSELIQAFRRLLLANAGRPLQLLLVGDGGEAARLKETAADLGRQVIFAGHQADPWPFFSIADVFVLPSHTEGSPLVLFEAMNAGLPIVASSVGGIPEVVQHDRSALLTPPNDARSLQEALNRLVRDSGLCARLSAAAREKSLHYGPGPYVERLLALYAELLGSTGSQI